jgi:cellulose synthase (UDP-forming)
MSRPQIATLVMLAVTLASAAIVTAWFTGQGTISRIFEQLNRLQEHPPLWLEVPMVAGEYLLFPTVVLLVLVLVVMRVSPVPRAWSRLIVVGTLLALMVRYVLWRSLSTLNLDRPLDGVFSLLLLALELLMLTNAMIQLFLMVRVRDRRPEADVRSLAVLEGTYLPAVDVLIPTYDEPAFILKRTVIGCQAMDYPRKTIYLLDDTRRPEIAALARQLGCEYTTRPDNRHAKAGNLNHAVALTNGELIVVFDADFIPTRHFLTRTVGFFQDDRVALVQTPQSFYNPDPIARNLGLENVLTPEEEVFYRQIQPIRDGVGSVICSGTSFVVRRTALEEAGGFNTDSISEDYFTGIALSAKGHRLVYLDEKLSAGLAAENIAAHATQRLRWARGTLQAFFIQANPLTIPGLNLVQRIAHLEGLLHWFTSLARVGFLLMPLAYSFLGVIPLRATPEELMFFFLPFYLVQLSAFAWLNYRSRSALLSDIYSLVLAFPLAITVIQVMLKPFSRGFRVTPKGTASDRFAFNWHLAWPLMLLFVATAFSLWTNLGLCMIKGAWQAEVPPEMAIHARGIWLGWVWSAYNLVMLGIALLILLDVPRPHRHEWFDLRRVVKLTLPTPPSPPTPPTPLSPLPTLPQSHCKHQPNPFSLEIKGDRAQFWGITTMISEAGAEIALTQAGFPYLGDGDRLPLEVEMLEEGLRVPGEAHRIGIRDEYPVVRVQFRELSLEQERKLITMLYCRPGQWKRRCSPNEWQSILLLLKVLLRPRIIFDRRSEVRAIAVSKV